jgi:predicted metal-dependent HD superfamily phosphohydrolase
MKAALHRCAPPGLELGDEIVATLEQAYGTAGRAYHTLDHVAEVATEFEHVAAAVGWDRPKEVYLAILFHDAVYVPGASDNESKSAELARRHTARLGVDVERIAALIEKTAVHGKLTPADVDRDEALFLDCDMAILGAAPERFDDYDDAIAEEYSAIPREAYAAGRRAFLERLLSRPRIFLSDHMHARLDAAARANLRRALTGRRDLSRAPRGG